MEGWYCLQTRPKQEHLAAGALRTMDGVEVLCPRIRYRKQTKRGPVWFVESIFPGYLFSRFNYHTQHRQVRYSGGILRIVQFGDYTPQLDDLFIDFLKKRFSSAEQEVIPIEPDFETGDNVTLVSGAFAGLEAIITRVIPARERIHVLLEFLGRQVEAEISKEELLFEDNLRCHPLAIT